MKQQIEQIKTADLVPYARNAKKHDEAQVAKLAGSIREFGFNNPVLLDVDNGIIAGHGRVMAAQKLGLTSVPCLRLSHLSETQKRAYILADNRLAELGGGWDAEMLKLELADLGDLDVDLDGIGFGADDLQDLDLSEEPETSDVDAEPQIDKAEELRAKWGVEPGQLWELGDHRLLCGDSTKKEDVERVMGGNRAQATITDPPYSVNYENQEREPGRKTRKQRGDDYRDPLDPAELLRGFVSAVPSDVLVMTYPVDKHFHALSDATRDFALLYECVWVKNHFAFVLGKRYQQKHEPILIFRRKGENGFFDVPPDQSTVFEYDKPASNPNHPTPKPIQLWELLVRYHSERGAEIYEPFSGSGTTIIACEQLGRKCRAIEISPAYVAVALQRWADATGKTPKLVA